MWITRLMLLQSMPRPNAMVTTSTRWIHVLSLPIIQQFDFVHAQGMLRVLCMVLAEKPVFS